MSFFIDANVILYAAGEDDRAEPSQRVLEAIARGDAPGHCSPAVLEEVWHLELAGRIPGLGGVTERALTVLAPLLPVSEEALRRALELPARELGANDRLHAGTCLAQGIETIVSADRSFDELELPRRVDPLDARALAALLAEA